MTPEEAAAAMPHVRAAAAAGLLPFPVKLIAGVKKPARTGWQRTVWDLGMLEQALLEPKCFGYGLTLPKADPRRLVDLDLDDGGEGLQPGQTPWQERLAAVEGEFGALPATKTTETPSGGQHRWFLWPDDVPLPAGSWHGFTVRMLHGAKNYVVGPGSVRDGRAYVNPTSGTPIATMPVELAKSGIKSKINGASMIEIKAPYQLPESVDHGDCHLEVCRYTLSLWQRRHTLSEMWTLVLHELGPKLASKHTEEHLRRHFDSATADLATKYPRDGAGYIIGQSAGGGPSPVADATPAGIDAADLLAMDLPPLRMIVPDLLPDGTTVLASPPKVGKSCLVYQIAVEVALGGALFGRRVEPGAVLYLALEDGARRGQARLRAALEGRTMPGGRLEVRWSAPPIGDGLEEELVAWLDAHPDAAVVAIDTLQRVRQRTNGKRGAYEVDVDDLGRLQAVFRDRRVALLIVHHSRKEAGDDFLASVSGTYGITGSADTIVVIRRLRMETFGTIRATGRDIPEVEVPVLFDGMLWRDAPGSLPEASFERQEVYQVIANRGPIFPAAIAKELGTTRQTVQNMVAGLHRDGAVARTSGGYTVTRGVSISPVSRMSDRESVDIGDTRARKTPVNLHAEAIRIFGDDLVRPAL